MRSDFALKFTNVIHRNLLRFTRGRIGWTALGMPAVRLTTLGRKSGQPRTVMLASPLREGDTWVVVASRGGDDHHPAWFLNLRDNPEVEVATKGQKRQPMRARIANAEERARLWPQVTAKCKN